MEYYGRMKNIEGLYHKNSRVTTVKYLSNHSKHRYGLVDETNKKNKTKKTDPLYTKN